MQKVALVLSSGGSRGFAHIGAIEELIHQDFQISSICGCSFGALIGGMYALGKLEEFKDMMYNMSTLDLASMIDVSVRMSYFVKGEKMFEKFKLIAPDVLIEDLPIPFTCVATDVKNGVEVVFDHGSLYDAIRASIAIPSLFKPQKKGDSILIDGGIMNSLPLNRVKRTPGDILVGVNVSGKTDTSFAQRMTDMQNTKKEHDIFSKMRPSFSFDSDNNMYSLIRKSFSLMIQQNTELMMQLYPPDIKVDIPMNRMGGMDYKNAEKTARRGRSKMREALTSYQKQ